MKKLFLFTCLLLTASISVKAEDTIYTAIREIKTFPGSAKIYLNGAKHTCGEPQDDRYDLTIPNQEYFSLLLTAYASNWLVNIYYSCASDGYPTV